MYQPPIRPYRLPDPDPRDRLLTSDLSRSSRELSAWAAHRSAVSQALRASSTTVTSPQGAPGRGLRRWPALLYQHLLRGRRSGQRPLLEPPSTARLTPGRDPEASDPLHWLRIDRWSHDEQNQVETPARTEQSIDEMYRVRAVLDGLSAEAVTRRHVDGQVAPSALRRLWDLAAVADRATRSGNLQDGAWHNRAFHQAIASLSGDDLVLDLLDQVWERIQVSTESSLQETGRRVAVHDEHLVVLTRVAAGDADGAFVSARQHALATIGARRRHDCPH